MRRTEEALGRSRTELGSAGWVGFGGKVSVWGPGWLSEAITWGLWAGLGGRGQVGGAQATVTGGWERGPAAKQLDRTQGRLSPWGPHARPQELSVARGWGWWVRGSCRERLAGTATVWGRYGQRPQEEGPTRAGWGVWCPRERAGRRDGAEWWAGHPAWAGPGRGARAPPGEWLGSPPARVLGGGWGRGVSARRMEGCVPEAARGLGGHRTGGSDPGAYPSRFWRPQAWHLGPAPPQAGGLVDRTTVCSPSLWAGREARRWLFEKNLLFIRQKFPETCINVK